MTTGKKILLVDDDDELRESLSDQLRLHEEFLTAEAATAAEALEITKGEYFDAIILDVGLPDMDGREVCRLMRRNGVKSPIIMLTGQDTDADQILPGRAGRLPRADRSQTQSQYSNDRVQHIIPFDSDSPGIESSWIRLLLSAQAIITPRLTQAMA